MKEILEDGCVVRDEEFDAAWAVGIVGRADFVEEVLYLRQFFPDDVKTTLTRERAEEVWDSATR